MARRLVWSPESLKDAEAIAGYIASDSIYYARKVVLRLISTAESIPDNPQSGRVVPEIGDGNYRERFVHKFRLIYRTEPERIVILAIIHGSRQLEPHANGLRNLMSEEAPVYQI